MTMRRSFSVIEKFAGAALSERQLYVRISDATPDRAGDIVEPAGCDHGDYDRNPIVLADHDPTKPIGCASVEVKSDGVYALIEFAPAGASAKADEYCALAKAGILGAASIGFRSLESKPLGTGGLMFLRWELLEISLVSVPANANALIVQRAYSKTTAPDAARAEHIGDLIECLAALGQRTNSAARNAGWVGHDIEFARKHHLSAADEHAAALGDGELTKHLAKLERARTDVADLVDQIHDALGEMDDHAASATKRAAALDRDAGERALSALRRKHAILERSKRFDEIAAKSRPRPPYPAPPDSFAVIDPSRQVRAVITDERETMFGQRVLLDGLDLTPYGLSRAAFADHKKTTGCAIAWCATIERRDGQLSAVLQFPAPGISKLADRVFTSIKSGERRAISCSYLPLETRRSADGVEEVTRSTLLEISVVRAGANKAALITEIGGVPVDGIGSRAEAGGKISRWGIDNARAQAKILYGTRWGLAN